MTLRGVTFGEYHSFYDFNLILSTYEIPPATPKTSYIDVPGGDGSLDLTEAHGGVKYNDRDISFTFTVHPLDKTPFEEKKTQISNALNGKRCKITLDCDEDYYYIGRVTVADGWKEKKIKKITVNAKVFPYKLKQDETVISAMMTETEQTLYLYNGRKAVIPIIVTTGEAKIVFGNNVYNIAAGTHRALDLCLVEGENALAISGDGEITFTYQEGDL